MSTKTTSNLFKLDWQDLLGGLVLAVIAPVILIMITSLNAGTLTFNWDAIKIAALVGGLSYLSKKLFTSSKEVTKK